MTDLSTIYNDVNVAQYEQDAGLTVVGLGTHLHGLVEVLGSNGEDHEFLESESVSSVRSTVDDVEGGAGEDVGRSDTSERGEVSVKRDTLSSSPISTTTPSS